MNEMPVQFKSRLWSCFFLQKCTTLENSIVFLYDFFLSPNKHKKSLARVILIKYVTLLTIAKNNKTKQKTNTKWWV